MALVKPIEIPNGWFSNGLLLFCDEEIDRRTTISKGFYLDLPDQGGISSDRLEQVHFQLQGILGAISDDMALQFHWSVDADYQEELEEYHRLTQERARNRWSTFVRMERFGTFVQAVKQHRVRRERLAVFLSRKCTTIPKRGLRQPEDIDHYLIQQEKSFLEKINTMEQLMPEARFRVMDDKEHCFFYRLFLNPSISRVNVPKEQRCNVDISRQILQQTLHSDGIAVHLDECAAFKMDGLLHGIIVIRRWPQMHYSGMMDAITNSLGMDFCITQNIFPLKVREEVRKEEKAVVRLRGDATHGKRYSLWSEVARKEAKIQSLMMGDILPFNVLTVIRTWDKTVDGLSSKMSLLKTALSNLSGCEPHQSTHPARTKNLFFETFPGWLGGRCREWDIYAESDYLANLLPVTSTYIGDLDAGEAIYHGDHGGIVGIKTFAGSTPQHALMLGMRGAGKSVLVTDILSQTEPFFDYTAIVEEGLSYGTYTKTMGFDPIIIHPDGDLTFNYFDTLQMPLSNENISIAAALCLKMVGTSSHEDLNHYRLAMLTEYIQLLFDDVFKRWTLDHEEECHDLNRMAYAVYQYRKSKLPPNSTFVEAFVALLDWEQHNPDDAMAFEEQFLEEEVIAFSQNNRTSDFIRNLAFAKFNPEEYPTHSELVDLMGDPLEHHKREEVEYLQTMLSAWSRHSGKNGVLFDGVTNFQLGQKIDHFELGYIPDANKELKSAAGFLLSNFVRQSIIRRPRGTRKRKVIEEAARFLDIPGGDKLLAEDYAQMRKFGCWVITVTQQINQLMETKLWPVIRGNSTTKFFMRQNNRQELERISQETGLPDRQIPIILNYPLPEHIRGQKYSSATYMTDTEDGMHCGTIRSYPSDELLYMASSDGSVFDERMRTLSGYEDATVGILKEVERKREAGSLQNGKGERVS